MEYHAQVVLPSLVHGEDMYIMPSTPLTCCSIGAATASATLARCAGIGAIDRDVRRRDLRKLSQRQVSMAMPPARVITIDSTEAKIGRSMKNRVNKEELSQLNRSGTPSRGTLSGT